MTAEMGYCPICFAASKLREKRPNGDDICYNNHHYKSSSALKSIPDRETDINAIATAFELLLDKSRPNLSKLKLSVGVYQDPFTDTCWRMFLAGAQLSATERK